MCSRGTAVRGLIEKADALHALRLAADVVRLSLPNIGARVQFVSGQTPEKGILRVFLYSLTHTLSPCS